VTENIHFIAGALVGREGSGGTLMSATWGVTTGRHAIAAMWGRHMDDEMSLRLVGEPTQY
jgi:hypothetical protein